jgi:cell division protein FtsN
MQDLSKFKKRETVEIHKRYLSLLAIGSVATVGLVFALGLLLGSRRSEAATTCHEPDLLTRLNEQSGEPEPPRSVPRHTFHETLNTAVETVPTPASLIASETDSAGSATPRETLANVAVVPPRGAEDPILEKIKDGDSGVYTLQVGSFSDIREASLMVEKLGRAGHKAFTVSVEMPDDRGTWYRVRVGPFSSKKAAWDYKRIFEEKERLPAFVVKKRA